MSQTDYLKEDPPITGQDWTVLSIVSPNDMVSLKNLYYSNHFMVNDINKTITAQAVQMAKFLNAKLRSNISDVLDKLQASVDDDDKRAYDILNKRYSDMEVDEDEFIDECRRKYELDEEEIMDRYKVYIAEHRQRLDREFDEAHDDAVSTRGFKVRGSYQRLQDARARAKMLRDSVEPAIHTFVAPVGKWLPVDFEADEAQEQEYMLPQLNDLMKKYHEGMHAKDVHYQDRKREMEEKANSNNKKTYRDVLREKLRQKRNEKMKRELDELQQMQDGTTQITKNQAATKSKKTRRSRKKKNTEAALTN